jgi:hypothetical protein
LVGQLDELWVLAVVHLWVEEAQLDMVFDKGEEDNEEVLHIPADIEVFHT